LCQLVFSFVRFSFHLACSASQNNFYDSQGEGLNLRRAKYSEVFQGRRMAA
jgi:hypothetical protein